MGSVESGDKRISISSEVYANAARIGRRVSEQTLSTPREVRLGIQHAIEHYNKTSEVTAEQCTRLTLIKDVDPIVLDCIASIRAMAGASHKSVDEADKMVHEALRQIIQKLAQEV